MAATVGDLSLLAGEIAKRGFTSVTIRPPEYLGGGFMVNVRRNAGWCCGEIKPTLEAAFLDAFEKAKPFSKRERPQAGDDLAGLLG